MIPLLDLNFPGINKLFTSPSRESDGYEKWVDFVLAFSHCDMISKLTIFAIIQAAKMLNSAIENCHAIQIEMNRIEAQLPEYDIVMSMYGVGKAVGLQLIAEIGDPRRFHSRKAITAYFGYDSENNDSGKKVSISNSMTKKGSGALRRTLFIIMQVLLQTKPTDNPVYDFPIKKQSEGKHYYSYMNAAANKFLHIYYARVKEVLIAADTSTT